MPFCSTHGGWVERYQDPKGEELEMHLCKGWQMSYDLANPMTYRVWYSGSFSKVDRNFNENEIALWRVQTNDFDDDKWEWWFSETIKKRWNLHEVQYIEDPNDVICTNNNLKPDERKFEFPIWVLEYMVQIGLIRNENMIRMIETRKKMESEVGYSTHTIKERDNSNLKVTEFRKKKGEEKKNEVDELLNPQKESKKGKGKEKALV